MLVRFGTKGAAGLVHRGRGRAPNNAAPADRREAILTLVRERFPDFGPTSAAEKLAEVHGIRISHETLRKWMIADGLWASRRHNRALHQPRLRRECLGELIQIDGSDHRWFEDRGPACTLLVFIDDATSTLMHLEFVVRRAPSAISEPWSGI